jgi:hypothetical protein
MQSMKLLSTMVVIRLEEDGDNIVNTLTLHLLTLQDLGLQIGVSNLLIHLPPAHWKQEAVFYMSNLGFW